MSVVMNTNVYNVYVHALNVTKLTSSSTNGIMNNEGVVEVCGGGEIKLTL